MQSSPENRAAIRSVAALASLSDADCDGLLRFMRARTLAASEVLFRQGDPGDTLVLVVNGLLAVQVARKGGAQIEVARIGRGEVVGESACLDPAPRSATVSALSSAIVYELSREAMTTMRQYVPRVASLLTAVVIADVTRRLREVDARIERELSRLQGAP